MVKTNQPTKNNYMQSNRKSSPLPVGMWKGTASLQDREAVSYKSKHTLIIQSSNQAPWYLFKYHDYVHIKNPHLGIYSSFIHNCVNLEAWPRLPSLGEWIRKLWSIRMEYYSVIKKMSYQII